MAKDPLTEFVDDHARVLTEKLDEYSVEVGWLLALILAYGGAFLAVNRDPVAAGAIVFVGVMILAYFGRAGKIPSRLRFFHRSCESARVRRRWDRAIRHCEFKHRIPISHIEHTEDGYHARIKVGWGISLRDLQLQKERLAASMRLGELLIEREEMGHAGEGRAILTILIQEDYLEGAGGQQWPVPRPPKEFQ